MDERRRRLMVAAASLLLAGPTRAARLLETTPPQPAGPFYPPEFPLDDDNDLTRLQGRGAAAEGQITDLSGRVLDPAGQAVPGVRIEIWQCDALDSRGPERDANFQGHGHAVTGGDGGYRFRTIRPVPYPGRTPHIHVAVLREHEALLVTQLYVEGEPRNGEDFLFNRVPVERRQLVLARFRPAADHSLAELEARFDIVLGGGDGTPPA
jgi:protocatechuate 3,4-dioxygenase beta subunit